MHFDEKFDLISRNLQEITGEDELKKILKSGKELSIYWGTMPTGSISVAYFFPMLKIADFLKAGCKVKILIADIHAALDTTPWEVLNKRYLYYGRAILDILKVIGVDSKKLEFVKGSDYQLKKDYVFDLLKLSTMTSVHDARKSASDMVKNMEGDNAKVSGFIYPLMQALDEQYLGVDAQFGGMDQRKVFMYAREFLPKVNYKPRIELMNPMIRGLIGEKMSSSNEATKIDLLDDEEKVKRKINHAECAEGNPDNGIMALLKYLIFVLKQDQGKEFIVERPAKFGGDLGYKDYETLEKDFIAKKIHPLDLKNSVAKEINVLLEILRKDKKLLQFYKDAYE